MLCAIRETDNEKVSAFNSNKAQGPFRCPACSELLNIRKGEIKIHHFAHQAPKGCLHGQGESEAHRQCKMSIHNLLIYTRSASNIEMEKDLGTVRADIYAEINGTPVAIEIQRSNLSVKEITARTVAYEKLGISVLWLALFSDKLEKKKYSPKAWEKWCHAVYFGRVFYWVSGLTIQPIHFGKFQTYVEESNWHDQYGFENTGGGYYKTSKRYKTPLPGMQLNLAEDFISISKDKWVGGSVYVPKSLIYCNTMPKWWGK